MNQEKLDILQAKTKADILQAKTKGTEYQAKAKDGVKNKGNGVKNKAKTEGVKNHDFPQAETKGIGFKNHDHDFLQAETEGIGVKNQEKPNILQAKTKANNLQAKIKDIVEYETGTKQTVNLQAEAGDKQTDLHQAKTEGTEYQAKVKRGKKNEGIGVKSHVGKDI